MEMVHAKQAFIDLVEGDGLSIDKLRPEQGINLMLQFYEQQRAEKCPFDIDGDMLLYQWGIYDWGKAEHFELDLTRQLIEEGRDDDDIWQLSLTFSFNPTDLLAEIGSGNRWCHSLDELANFRSFILDSIALAKVASLHSLTK